MLTNPRITRSKIAAVIFAALLLPTLASAALTWDTQRIALKTKPSDKQVEGLFHFSNTGHTTVTIVHIQPSCGCTSAQLEKRVYAPGESGEIKAIFTIGDRVGEQEKTIFISTDDSPDKQIPLVLQVTIPELLTYSPRLLMWNVGEKPEEKPTAISASSELRLTAVEITAPVPDEVVTRIASVEAGVRYQLFIRPVSTAAVMHTPVAGIATFSDGTTQPFKIYALVR